MRLAPWGSDDFLVSSFRFTCKKASKTENFCNPQSSGGTVGRRDITGDATAPFDPQILKNGGR